MPDAPKLFAIKFRINKNYDNWNRASGGVTVRCHKVWDFESLLCITSTMNNGTCSKLTIETL